MEDVVTSGGAAIDSVKALRAAGLECGTAVCVVDREEGGADALARAARAYDPCFAPPSCSKAVKLPLIRMVEPKRLPW